MMNYQEPLYLTVSES